MKRAILEALQDRGVTVDEVLKGNDHTCTICTGYAPGHIRTYCGEVARYATSQFLVGALCSPMGQWYCHYRCQQHLDSLLK